MDAWRQRVILLFSICDHIVKYPTGVKPLMVYYGTGPEWVPGIPNPEPEIFIHGNWHPRCTGHKCNSTMSKKIDEHDSKAGGTDNCPYSLHYKLCKDWGHGSQVLCLHTRRTFMHKSNTNPNPDPNPSSNPNANHNCNSNPSMIFTNCITKSIIMCKLAYTTQHHVHN